MIRLYLGKSSAGKDYFCKKTHKASNGKIKTIVSYTTRPPREGEVNGVDYWFISKKEFLEKVASNDIIEYRMYKAIKDGKEVEWYYGTPRVNPEENYVAVIEINGALAFIEAYGSDNLEIIYVYADDAVRESRAKMRGSFDQAEWNRRMEADNNDFSEKRLQQLLDAYGRPISTIDNSGDRVVFGELKL